VRSDHLQTRFNEMPAFGPLEMLNRSEIRDVAEHVLALRSGQFDDLDGAAERILFDDEE
jgi:cytochrome c oxidase cbb3-type subunit III